MKTKTKPAPAAPGTQIGSYIIGQAYNGLVFKSGTCDCGQVINGQFRLPENNVQCCECHDRHDRKNNGWTPSNSCD